MKHTLPYFANLSPMRGRPQGFWGQLLRLEERPPHAKGLSGWRRCWKKCATPKSKVPKLSAEYLAWESGPTLVWLCPMNLMVGGCLIRNLSLLSQPASGMYPWIQSINIALYVLILFWLSLCHGDLEYSAGSSLFLNGSLVACQHGVAPDPVLLLLLLVQNHQ